MRCWTLWVGGWVGEGTYHAVGWDCGFGYGLVGEGGRECGGGEVGGYVWKLGEGVCCLGWVGGWVGMIMGLGG